MRKNLIGLVLALAAAALAGGLTACQTAQAPPEGPVLAWVTHLSWEDVTYYPLEWLDRDDPEGETRLRESLRRDGPDSLGRPATAPLDQDAALFLYYPNSRTDLRQVLLLDGLNPEESQISSSDPDGGVSTEEPVGELCELTFDETGALTNAVLRREACPEEQPVLALGTVDDTRGTVSFRPLQWFGAEDPGREEAWWAAYWERGLAEEELTAPLADGAQLLYAPRDGGVYPLNPVTVEYSIRQSQAGRLLELAFDREGRVARLVMRGDVSLDLSGADLDFTGYTGPVYALGMGRIDHTGEAVSLDPCGGRGEDEDHAQYSLPLARGMEIPGEVKAKFSGLSSGRYPPFWRFTLENGAVTAVEEFWPEGDLPTQP